VTELQHESSRRKRLSLFIALPLIAVAVLATACGGGSTKTSSSASTSTTTPAGSTAAASRAKFTQCLESHGVPASVASAGFGGGRRGAGGSTSSTTTGGSSSNRSSLFTQYQSAFTACRSDLPSGFGGGGNFNSAASAAYRNCLTLHGVTVPTTTPGSPRTGGFSGGFGAASQSPAFQAAQKACASLLPARPSSSTTAPPAAS
jgi:hypothetical protein